MKHFPVYLFIIIFLYSCSTSDKNKTSASKENTHSKPEVDSSIPEMAIWADSCIIVYLEANKDRLTEVDGTPVSFMKHTDIRNDRVYAVAKIGHSFEYRYVTDQWIFIDSLTREIYEYDLPNDSLIHWSNDIKTVNPTGTYVLDSDTTMRDGEIFGYTGEIQVRLLSPDKIVMSFGVMKGAPSYNSGSFFDTLNYEYNRAIYTVPDIDSSCTISFAFSEIDVTVIEETDDYNHGCGFGHAVVADGRFIKESSKNPELRKFISDE